jgi:hypothetical protein
MKKESVSSGVCVCLCERERERERESLRWMGGNMTSWHHPHSSTKATRLQWFSSNWVLCSWPSNQRHGFHVNEPSSDHIFFCDNQCRLSWVKWNLSVSDTKENAGFNPDAVSLKPAHLGLRENKHAFKSTSVCWPFHRHQHRGLSYFWAWRSGEYPSFLRTVVLTGAILNSIRYANDAFSQLHKEEGLQSSVTSLSHSADIAWVLAQLCWCCLSH